MDIKKDLIYTFKIFGRKELVTGVVLDEGDEWILLQNIPVDFVIDGFKVVRKKYIEDIWRDQNERFKEAVLKAKNAYPLATSKYSLNTNVGLFEDLYNQEKIIQIDLKDASICYVGKINMLSEKSFRFLNLGTRGAWTDEKRYTIDHIRTVQFEHDYVLSLIAFNKTLSFT